MTAPQAAVYANRHPETIRKALASGELHGEQRMVRAPWTVKEACVDAYLRGEVCEHRRDNVVTLPARRLAGARR